MLLFLELEKKRIDGKKITELNETEKRLQFSNFQKKKRGIKDV